MFARCSDKSIFNGIRQIQRWILASKQDSDPKVKALHSSYAVGNLSMLREMVDDSDIIRVTGLNPLDLLEESTKLQDEANKHLIVK
jgi:hypothetical protein